MSQNWLIQTPAMLTLPARAARALIAEQNGAAALLYFHMQLNGGRLDAKAAQAELSLSDESLQKALNVLQQQGLVEPEGSQTRALQSDKRPDYSSNDLTDSITGDHLFKQVTEDVSYKLGRILSNNDLSILLGLYNWLGLSADVISLLVVYSIDEARRRYGEGKLPTLRQIEKMAVVWEREGLITAERAEQWIEERERARRDTVKIARILQITGRALTATEESYIGQWSAMGIDTEVIYAAYDKTVTRCGRLEWKYLHTILKSWHDKGLHTLEQIEGGDKKPAPDEAGRPVRKLTDHEKEALAYMKQFRN